MNLIDTLDLLFTSDKGWYGFDLDGTLFRYEGDHSVIGPPLKKGDAFKVLKKYVAQGKKCKIVTARVAEGSSVQIKHEIKAIQDLTQKYFGKRLEVVSGKDTNMIKLYDDKAVAVQNNTGNLI